MKNHLMSLLVGMLVVSSVIWLAVVLAVIINAMPVLGVTIIALGISWAIGKAICS